MDINFIEFYIKKRYSQKIEDYFGVVKSVASGWRHGKFPKTRLHEFYYREKTDNIFELFERIYKRE
jgi:hypothetical protein